MSEPTKQLKVDGLPIEVTSDQLRFFFRNKRRNGGGPVEDVEIIKNETDTCSAIITFQQSEAVDIILKRGNTVNFENKIVQVKPLVKAVDEPKSTQKKKKKINEHCTDPKVPKPEPETFKGSDESHLTRKKKSEDKEEEKSSESESESESLSESLSESCSSKTSEDEEEEPDDELCYSPVQSTIKAELIDVYKTKDFYILYFEDPNVSQGEFDEDSIMLDGFNKHLYVTFKTREAALKTCGFKHGKESNFSHIEMATEADFDTFSNLLAVYGYNMDTQEKRDKLVHFISKQTELEICNVIQEDEPRSAIIAFDPNSCEDISAATWKCATIFSGVSLITAPVFKFLTVWVKGLKPSTSNAVIQRYLSNKKRSGGGEVESVSRISETEAIVTFSEEASFNGVLRKSLHALEDKQLIIIPHYPCISAQVYQIYMERHGHSLLSCAEGNAEETSDEPQISWSKLEGHNVEFCSSASVPDLHHKEKLQGTVKLPPYRYQFLQNHHEALKKKASEVFCRVELSPVEIVLKLEWPQRLRAWEVKGKLNVAVEAVTQFLNSFMVVEFPVEESHIHKFEKFVGKTHNKTELEEDRVYFDYGSYKAVMIGGMPPYQKRTVINKIFNNFCSKVLRKDLKDGLKFDKEKDGKKLVKETISTKKHGDDRESQKKETAHKLSGKPAFKGQDGAKPPKDETDSSKDEESEEEDEDFLHSIDMDVEKNELLLLKKSNGHKKIEKLYDPLKITLDLKNSKVMIKGNDEADAEKARFELYKDMTTLFKTQKMHEFSEDQLELLSKEDIQEKVNMEMDKKGFHAYVQCTNGIATLFYIKQEHVEANRLIELVKSYVVIEEEQIDPEMMLIFKSERGRMFLEGLQQRSDGLRSNAILKLQDKSLRVVAPADQQFFIQTEMKKFKKENAIFTEEIPLSVGKKAFISRFQKEELTEIINLLKQSGADVRQEAMKFVVKGLKSGVEQGKKKLSHLSEQIKVDTVKLKYFGIQEFWNKGGKLIQGSIEGELSCIITPKDDIGVSGGKGKAEAQNKTLPVPTLKPIVRFKTDNCSIILMQGDIAGLKADAVVNPLDSSLEFKTGLSRDLISRGGPSIKTELEDSKAGKSGESVIETTAGEIKTFKKIIHMVCPVYDDSHHFAELEGAVMECLSHARREGYEAIGFTTVILGKVFKYPTMGGCVRLVKAVKKHLDEGDTSLSKIYFCDGMAKNLSQLMDNCESIFDDPEKEKLGDLVESDHESPRHFPRSSPEKTRPERAKPPPPQPRKNFKHLNVNIVKGEINKEKTDVIVITVDKSLDLSKGRIAQAVLNEGGDTLQEELSDNYQDGIKSGSFAQSSGGNLQCQRIFYACLSRYRGDDGSIIGKLVYQMMEEADQRGDQSMSIPALGTGNLKYPDDISAHQITDAICKFAKKYPRSSLKQINLVVFPRDRGVLQTFKDVVSGGGGRRRGQDEDDDFDESQGASASGHKKSFFSRVTQHFTGKGTNMTFGSVTLKIKKGDITEEKCDAIVNSIRSSMDLSSSGAVCKAILKKCGSDFQEECYDKTDDIEQNGVAVTSAPGLNCKNIIHVSMNYSSNWEHGVVRVLEEAERQGMKSLALPALGAGAKKAAFRRLKEQIFGAIKKFGKGSPKLRDIRLVIFTQDVLHEFTQDERSHSHDSHHKQGHGDSQISSHTTKVSEEMELKVYALSNNIITRVKSRLDEECKNAFRSEKEKDKHLKELHEDQIQDLKHFALEHKVHLEIKLEDGIIIMKTFAMEGIARVIRKIKELVLESVEGRHQSLYRVAKSTFQWQFEQGKKWRDFENLQNLQIETEYKKHADTLEIEDERGRKYEIDFTKMEEYTLDSQGNVKHETKIRRFDHTKVGEPLPKNWAHMSNDENLKIVQLKQGSPEYKGVEQKFVNAGAGVPIKKIERIQNKALYQQYQVKKREMDQRNPKGHKNEQILYHGTDAATVQSVISNGFSRNYSGKNATAYGEGVYFATQSSYSVNYARPDASGIRQMFQAKVLVGESTASSSGMKYLPNKHGTNIPYDSGSASGMYIIFHDSQTYPEYLISF